MPNHDEIVNEFRQRGNGPAGMSACEYCPQLSKCREALKKGKLFACQSKATDRNTDDLIPRRFKGDYDQLLADHAPTGYHRPTKKQIITGA